MIYLYPDCNLIKKRTDGGMMTPPRRTGRMFQLVPTSRSVTSSRLPVTSEPF